MRNTLFLTIVAAAFVALSTAGQIAFAQPLLNQLEQRLAAQPSGSAASAPGSGYLGAMLDEDRAGVRGVRVTSVKAGTPAETGGLKSGDLITAIDTKPIAGMNQLDEVLNKATAGQSLLMTVDRAGRTQSLTVTLGARPSAAATSQPEPAGIPPATTPSFPSTPTLTEPATGAAPAPNPLLAPPLPAAGAAPTEPATSPPATSPPATAPPATAPPATAPPATAPLTARPLDLGPPPATGLPIPEAADRASPSAADPLPAPSLSGGGANPSTGGASLGISVDSVSEEARATYGLPIRRGAFISAVKPESPADRAGLPVGGVVVAIDGRRIDSASDLISAIRSARVGQEVELGYYQGSRFTRKTVRLAPAPVVVAPPPPPPVVTPAPAAPDATERPLLNRIERAVENQTPPRTPAPSYRYDPSEMATLQNRVTELTEQVRALEERLKAIESKLPGGPAPGFGGFAPTNP